MLTMPQQQQQQQRRQEEELRKVRAVRELLPNFRVWHRAGGKLCYRSSQPFGLTSGQLQPLLDLGLRTIVDLRADWERSEDTSQPLYEHYDLRQWSGDSGNSRLQLLLPAATQPPVGTIFRVDCFKSGRQQQLRYLRRRPPPSGLAGGHLAPFLQLAHAAKTPLQQYQDAVDSFPAAFAFVFSLVAEASSHPLLLTCREGQHLTGVVCSILQLLLGEETSLIAESFAVSQVELHQSTNDCSGAVMLQLLRYLLSQYRTVENYLVKAGLTEGQIRSLKT